MATSGRQRNVEMVGYGNRSKCFPVGFSCLASHIVGTTKFTTKRHCPLINHLAEFHPATVAVLLLSSPLLPGAAVDASVQDRRQQAHLLFVRRRPHAAAQQARTLRGEAVLVSAAAVVPEAAAPSQHGVVGEPLHRSSGVTPVARVHLQQTLVCGVRE